jgi:hypothetical protein
MNDARAPERVSEALVRAFNHWDQKRARTAHDVRATRTMRVGVEPVPKPDREQAALRGGLPALSN